MRTFIVIVAAGALACATASRETYSSQSGSDREQVRLVQRSLASHGYGVSPTGTMDEQTRAALTQFQRANSLPETGAVDTDTARALGVNPDEVMAVRGESAPDWRLREIWESH